MRVRIEKVIGASGFALAQYEQEHVKAFVGRLQGRAYNLVRVLSETGEWGGGWLPKGPAAGSLKCRKDLDGLLSVTAEMGIWVELVVSGTIKNRPLKEQMGWAKDVVKAVKGMDHVIVNVMNEPQQSSLTEEEVLELTHFVRTNTAKPVGIDVPGPIQSYVFPASLKKECDWIGCHPTRDPEPTKEQVMRWLERNGLTLFNETNCYISDEEKKKFKIHGPNGLFYCHAQGTETQRKNAARRAMKLFAQVGMRKARWYFHSLSGIHCMDTDFWAPDVSILHGSGTPCD